MTNKEALEILEKSIRCYGDDCPPVACDDCPYSVTTEQFDNAFQMAMDALKTDRCADCRFTFYAKSTEDETT